MSRDSSDRSPKVTINTPAWRIITIGSLVVSVSLGAALLAQDGLFSPGSEGADPDGLTTLALVLAILAFFIQIFVFIFQTQAATASLRRSERLNAETHEVLSKIETNSSATQKVLFSQFDRLLDYVVGDAKVVASPASPEEFADSEGSDAELAAEGGPVTVADVTRIFNELSRPKERPHFEVPGPSEEDRRIIQHLEDWPSREDAEAAVRELTEIPPLAVASLTRFATIELIRRRLGQSVAFRRVKKLGPITRLLMDRGYLRADEEFLYLTDRGRDVVRVLPIGKTGERPDWVNEVMEPLTEGA